ncbi:MAG: ABC transporter substrate-binding protein [Candidatus Lokiarchaeota archaeon]|nr:ABC transporter substrate-binding protein [Candidatus Lokiarchaeota archaeon]
MELEKKNLAIIILSVVLVASGVGNVILAITSGLIVEPDRRNTIIVGAGSNLAAIDPLDTWDVPSNVAEHQVAEGLVDYDYTDHPNYRIVPKLAESWIWNGPQEISFKIRENVYFHDGNLLTANDVKWNFDRLMYFINWTGDLVANDTSWEAFPSALYFFSDGSPILNRTEVSSDYNFTVYLNKPFGAFLDLMTFSATYILSPASTPRYRYLDMTSEKIVGTGPFQFIRFKYDVDVRFERWDRYWATGPWAELLVFKILEDDTARMTAGLAEQFDYIGGVPKSFIPSYISDPDLHVQDVGEDLCYFYLEIYCGPPEGESPIVGGQVNQKNPAEFRKALALVINYTYILEEIQNGYAFTGCPAVPRAMPGYNSSLEGKMASDNPFGGTYESSIKKAREIMMSLYPTNTSGLDPNYPGTTESGWSSLSIDTLEVNQHFGDLTNLRLNQLMTANFDLIGIDIDITTRTWGEYLDTGEHTPWEMDLGYIGWCPDYLDAFNMLDPLFNNLSGSCFSRISDPDLITMLETASALTNSTERQEVYMDIQSYIYDITRTTPASYTHIPGWVFLIQQVHKTDLKGVGYNVMAMLDCWNWYKE